MGSLLVAGFVVPVNTSRIDFDFGEVRFLPLSSAAVFFMPLESTRIVAPFIPSEQLTSRRARSSMSYILSV